MNNFDFKNPPDNLGEVSFFWWHGDDITKEKLLWILEQLKDKHICGLQINYCHGNSGGMSYGLTMETNPKPFSDAWWELVEWFMGECKKYGIAVSLSDYTLSSPGQEYFADWLLEKNPDMIGQRLVMKDGKVEIETVPFSMNPIGKGIGQAYVDEFYNEFERRIPGECGKGINYFFSDELNFNIEGNLWCDDFKEEFLARKGYDITEKWNAIFEDIGNETKKIRLDYYDVIVQLTEERFFKVVYDWHEDRGMTFGCDHGGRGSRVREFGDYFRTMKWYQGPGNDQSRLRTNITRSKCSVSIAHIYNRPRVWLEGFYSSGWDTGCDDVADATFRNFALGHNLLSLHGLYYSTHGSMWEWAPPCNHHHMPYWEQMGDFLGCTKRLSYLNATGVHCCDIAIVYPVAAMEADEIQGKASSDTAFASASYLYTHGFDFDFIDFESIQRADIEDSKLCVSGECFRTVIVPEMKTVRYGMIDKLRKFAQAGGQVIFLKCLPDASDRIGSNDAVLDKTVSDILNTGCLADTFEEITDAITKHYTPDFACGVINPFFNHRRIEGKDYYMVYRLPEGTKLSFRAKGYPVMLNPWNGDKYRLCDFTCKGDVTEIPMPLSNREMFIVMFETDESVWAEYPTFIPFGKNDEVIGTDGVWESKLIPTMNNLYGDWRLPAFDGFIGAEAREMEYCFCDDMKVPENATWKKSRYSYGTYFHIAEGEQDEEKLINATAPTENMKEYRHSMKYGVEGDAGEQNSYHGLKGVLSDEFLVMGEKFLKHASSSSYYEGEGPYYFFTTVSVDEKTTVKIETGEMTPEGIWIDHKKVTESKITLESGIHYILLKFVRGGKSHFVLKKSDTFTQNYPLVTSWYKNTDILTFDALPKYAYCCYKFVTPPGAKTMKVDTSVPVKAFANGKELNCIGDNIFEVNAISAQEVILFAKQSAGMTDTAIFDGPVTFTTGVGSYSAGESFKSQGLSFYSGGISLKKKINLTKNGKRIFFEFDEALGCCAEIFVGGKKAAVLHTKPYRCDITDFVTDGENEIEVRSYTSLHNHMKTIPTNFNQVLNQDEFIIM